MKNTIVSKVTAIADFLALIIFCFIWATTGGAQSAAASAAAVVMAGVLTFAAAKSITVMERKEAGKA